MENQYKITQYDILQHAFDGVSARISFLKKYGTKENVKKYENEKKQILEIIKKYDFGIIKECDIE